MADLEQPDPAQVREDLRQAEESRLPALGPVDDALEEFYLDIPASDGFLLKAKVCRPRDGLAAGRPLILLFYGGAYMGGSCEQCTLQGRVFAAEFGAVVVSGSYRLLPEYKMPRPTLDGIDVAKWLVDNAKERLGADPSLGFVVGGYSAGGHLASLVASKARGTDFTFPVTGSFLCIPTLLRWDEVPAKYKHLWTSVDELCGPSAPAERVPLANMFRQGGYLAALENSMDSPLGLGGLPPTWIQVGGQDFLRDDGTVYAKMLEDAGVPTKLVTYPELGHESWMIWTDESTESGQTLRKDAMDAMRWLLKM